MGSKNIKSSDSSKDKKKVIIAADNDILEFVIARYLVEPKYASVHSFPFSVDVTYITPSKSFSKKSISRTQPDLVITDTRYSDFIKVVDIVKDYNVKNYKKNSIPIMVTFGSKDKSYIADCLEHNVDVLFRLWGSSESRLVKTVGAILNKEEVEKMINFEAPRKTDPKVSGYNAGFSPYRIKGQGFSTKQM